MIARRLSPWIAVVLSIAGREGKISQPSDPKINDVAGVGGGSTLPVSVPGHGGRYVEGGDNMVPYSPLQVSEMSQKLRVIT